MRNLYLALAVVIGISVIASAAEPAEKGDSPVLDTFSYWREYAVFGKPVHAKTTAEAAPSADRFKSPPPPAEWRDAAFDDSTWLRGCGPTLVDPYGFRGNQALGLVCLRGKFSVDDPAAAPGLTLSARYLGGMVVYLNGKEVARGHMGNGEVKPESIAEEYPWDAYVKEDGTTGLKGGRRDRAANKERLESRIRRLSEVEIAGTGLRKGLNVLAVEIHPAPVHPDAGKLKNAWELTWSTLAFLGLELRAKPDAPVAANLGRPEGIQLWNADPMSNVFEMDYGDPLDELKPIRIAGTRNGTFVGQVVMSSGKPIRKPKAVAGELVCSANGSKIPADGIRVRYAMPTGSPSGGLSRFRSGQGGARFDALGETAPDEVKPGTLRGRSPVATGAVQPIWIIVDVPRDAAEGSYAGTLSVSAEGMDPVDVGVELSVAGWVLPDAGSIVSHVGIVESPESVALYYKKPLWSDEHWALVERSMKYLGEMGNNSLCFPLIAKHHYGKEGMVRWIKKPDGTYDHDYTLFEKYLDISLKHMGTPQAVTLYVWDLKYAGWYDRAKKKMFPYVTVVDQATGAVSEMECPQMYEEATVDFWKPVLEGCRDRLVKRKVPENVIMVGIASDRWPTEAETKNLRKAAPWADWVRQGHQDGGEFWKVPIKYLAFVWGARGMVDPSEKRLYGWKVEQIRTVFPRYGACRMLKSQTPFSNSWTLQEYMTASGYRGVSRIGADFWPVLEGSGNRKYGGNSIAGAYASWGQTGISESCLDLLYPGPDGALATLRLETYRQGIQEAEARIFIEQALDDKARRAKMGDELAKRAQDLLDERARLLVAFQEKDTLSDWFISTGWQKRTGELYTMAAEIAGAVK